MSFFSCKFAEKLKQKMRSKAILLETIDCVSTYLNMEKCTLLSKSGDYLFYGFIGKYTEGLRFNGIAMTDKDDNVLSTIGVRCVLARAGWWSMSVEKKLMPYQPFLYLTRFETMPEHKRKGYATKLLEFVIEHYKTMDIVLDARPKNDEEMSLDALVDFYRKHGFRQVKIRKNETVEGQMPMMLKAIK